jgi:hypothetical protein
MMWWTQFSYGQLVKKTINQLMKVYKTSATPLFTHVQYGMYPQALVMWLVFETITQYDLAQTQGLCQKIEAEFITALRQGGYPADGLVYVVFESSDRISSDGGGYMFDS